MTTSTVIGASARVRGRIVGAADVAIAGRVDGDVNVTGDVSIDPGALVGANVTARSVIVRGAVRGDVSAQDSILLEDGARVVGNVRAKRIAIAPGALVRGYVQTAGIEPAGEHVRTASARSSTAASVPVSPSARTVPIPRYDASPATPARSAPVAAPPRSPDPIAAAAPRGGPPAPVVPALKKGAKGSLQRKRSS